MQIKSVDVISKKYASRAGSASADYAAGVQSPRTDWAQATSAAATTYAAGVQQAVSNGSFQKGVNKAGTGKWQQKASTLGAQRYSSGVSAAAPSYASGVGPYLQALTNLTLPPRGPKGDPGNINRVAAVATAMRQVKQQNG